MVAMSTSSPGSTPMPRHYHGNGAWRQARALWLLLLPALMMAAAPAGSATEIPKHPVGPLQEAIYGFAVAEYCGLLTEAVAEGFHLERAWIIARDKITPEQEWADRIAANMAADYQYDDHGLGGYR